jgi:serine/threonine-protein kinase
MVTAAAAGQAAAAVAVGVGRLVSSDSIPVGGLTPGAILAERYRIIGLLGRGGMGEVYRADDLKLGQPVALKFLPASLSSDPVRRERFFAEVRITRQLAHPNICRVYDIGEADGQHFLSMEFIDGEDLASLVKRIGHLSNEKALDVARQLVAGLAAAHERGVLHRDLKPANIMLDGRGRVRITDFGLAVATEEEQRAGDVSGTPAYMAPEQLAGKGASVRSDIYALGLVLYELLSGQKAFTAKTFAELRQEKEQSTPTAPSELREGIEPALERLVMRCLERDPRARPSSVAHLAAALPGGDPLAAAIAAGETPSPELVAASGLKEGLRPAVAIGLVAVAVAATLATMAMNPQATLIGRVGAGKAPAVLVDRAREIIRQAGYVDAPADSAFGFSNNDNLLRYIRENDTSAARWEALPLQGSLLFWYRQSPRPLVRSVGFSAVEESNNPPLEVSGEVRVVLDTDEHLVALNAIPPQVRSDDGRAPATDWGTLMSSSRFDPAGWTPTEPRRVPRVFADSVAAWNVRLPQLPDIPFRVEAAAYGGRLVYVETIAPWSPEDRSAEQVVTTGERAASWLLAALFTTLLVGGFFLARRNLRLGRGDRRGTLRLAAFFGTLDVAAWMLAAHHVPTLAEIGLVTTMFAGTLFASGVVAMVYFALEPFVRRRWPQVLVSWARVLAGDWRDPLVGRDTLAGVAAGALIGSLYKLEVLVPAWFGYPPGALIPVVLNNVAEPTRFVSRILFDMSFVGIGLALAYVFLLVLLRVLLRREWMAVAVWMAVMSPGLLFLGEEALPVIAAFELAQTLILYMVITRFGLVAMMVAGFVLQISIDFPVTFDSSAWNAGYGYVALAIVAAIAFYAFKTSLAGRPVFAGGNLDG